MFDKFENIYLFGSLVRGISQPDDIDILLIYNNYSDNLLKQINEIRKVFGDYFNLPLDLIVLSRNEETDTSFINELYMGYIKIK